MRRVGVRLTFMSPVAFYFDQGSCGSDGQCTGRRAAPLRLVPGSQHQWRREPQQNLNELFHLSLSSNRSSCMHTTYKCFGARQGKTWIPYIVSLTAPTLASTWLPMLSADHPVMCCLCLRLCRLRFTGGRGTKQLCGSESTG